MLNTHHSTHTHYRAKITGHPLKSAKFRKLFGMHSSFYDTHEVADEMRSGNPKPVQPFINIQNIESNPFDTSQNISENVVFGECPETFF